MSILASDVTASIQTKGYGSDTATAQLEMVKSALRRVYTARRWRFLQKQDSTLTLTVGTGTKSLTGLTGLTHVDGVRIAFGTETYELTYRDYQALRTLDHEDRVADVPEAWTLIDSTTLQVWPRPERAYTLTIDYVYLPTLPATASAMLVFPDEHLDVLAWAACEEMAFRQRDYAAADRARARYDDALKDMVRAFAFTQRQSAAEVERWAGWNQVSH